jgi:hypothetical protein
VTLVKVIVLPEHNWGKLCDIPIKTKFPPIDAKKGPPSSPTQVVPPKIPPPAHI